MKKLKSTGEQGFCNVEPSPKQKALVENLFVYHKPEGDQAMRYAILREKAKEYADLVIRYTPESAEQTLAIRSIHTASMQANSAIACNEEWVDGDAKS